MIPQLPREIWTIILNINRKRRYTELRAMLHPKIERNFSEMETQIFHFGDSICLFIRVYCHEFVIQSNLTDGKLIRISQYIRIRGEDGRIKTSAAVGSTSA